MAVSFKITDKDDKTITTSMGVVTKIESDTMFTVSETPGDKYLSDKWALQTCGPFDVDDCCQGTQCQFIFSMSIGGACNHSNNFAAEIRYNVPLNRYAKVKVVLDKNIRLPFYLPSFADANAEDLTSSYPVPMYKNIFTYNATVETFASSVGSISNNTCFVSSI